MRADSAANFRQRIRLVTKIRGLQQMSLGNKLQPVGDVVVHGAFPFAVRIAAGNAALGLGSRALLVVLAVYLLVIADADFHAEFLRILAWYVDELKKIRHGSRSSAD